MLALSLVAVITSLSSTTMTYVCETHSMNKLRHSGKRRKRCSVTPKRYRKRRVASAARRKRNEAWRAFSRNVAEHLAWETFYALSRVEIYQALRCGRVLLQLHPSGLFAVLRRWTRPSTIITLITNNLTSDDLA